MKGLSIVLLALFLASCQKPSRLPPELPEPLPPSTVASMAESLYGALTLGKPLPSLPSDDLKERYFLLRLGDGINPPCRFQVKGKGSDQALKNLLDATQECEHRIRWLRLDAVRGIATIDDSDVQLERGMAGIASDTAPPKFWLPLEVPNSVLSTAGELKQEKLRALDPDCQRWVRFGTHSVFVDEEGVYTLFRGHRQDLPEREPEQMLAAARQGGDYLLRALGPDGRFNYLYYPIWGKSSNEYNMLRHAGSTYSLLQLYRETKVPKYLDGAKRAVDYLLYSVQNSAKTPDGKVLVSEDSVKLGGNALTVVALCEYVELSGDRTPLAEAADLAEWMVKNQTKKGRFNVHKESFPEGDPSGFISGYYPGEALLALTRLYALDHDERWLNAAKKSAHFLVQKARKENEPAHDHWLLIGLEALYRFDPDPAYPDYAFYLSKRILATQLGSRQRPDWEGGFYIPPRSTPTDIRVEGLNAAWSLAAKRGNREMAELLKAGVLKGLKFSALCEIRPEAAVLMEQPGYCKGGVMRALASPEIRIDYVQHHISALLGARKLLLQQDGLTGISRK